jgi:hypothetical protein
MNTTPQSSEGVPLMHRDLASRLKLEVAYEGGVKIKNGTWTPPMTYPESFAMLMRLAREQHIKLPAYLKGV